MWWLRYHLRNFFRSFMKPIPSEKAIVWHKTAQRLYILSGFSAFTYSLYIYHGNKDKIDQNPVIQELESQRLARLRGQPGTIIIKKIRLGEPTMNLEYNNEEYIKEYEEKLKNLQSQQISKLQT